MPKTGTTTLQRDVFPKASASYLGVRQPRNRRQSAVYRQMFLSIQAAGIATTKARDHLLRAMAAQASGDERASILSEEMFTVGNDWRMKLRRLAAILEGLDHTVLVTWRDPVDAAYSFYCEAHRMFADVSLVDAVRNHEAMQIYRGDTLARELADTFGADRVRMIRFEDLFRDQTGALQQILAGVGIAVPPELSLEVRNATSVAGSHVQKSLVTPIVGPVRAPKVLGALRGGRIARSSRFAESGISRILPKTRTTQLIPLMTEAERAVLEQLLGPHSGEMERFSVAGTRRVSSRTDRSPRT